MPKTLRQTLESYISELKEDNEALKTRMRSLVEEEMFCDANECKIEIRAAAVMTKKLELLISKY